MNSVQRSQFKDLFLQETPWIDVRAPIEFDLGSVPGATNLPLLTDNERHQIGLCYKTHGQSAAVELGHQLVSGEIRAARLRSWMDQIRQRPKSIVYCFRGGLRSQIVQTWLLEQGLDRPIVDGGYKALRRFFIETLEESVARSEFLVVSGPTGSGKTRYLHSQQTSFIDLEDLARHRGSAFGALPDPQPSQVNFENILALAFLRLSDGHGPVLIENESRMIGQRALPEILHRKMQSSKKLVLKIGLEERVENIFRDYILESSLGVDGDLQKFEDFRRAVRAISRKLGGARTQEILSDLDISHQEFQSGLGLESNRHWIRKLLVWYYDPLYDRSSK
ncbi:MAG: tRNA 2-selenouridine(34) synthase MnmH [Bdellovibrio sp. CG10_big_fil_rev_8_21_14_0_10_47_8]|nr:MAG: tRNA 2-selenouridine(34) synthase MnmH [Bdellovibrio sp. CG10_big_fil_rev_8_21_14_0_10_47_8]